MCLCVTCNTKNNFCNRRYVQIKYIMLPSMFPALRTSLIRIHGLLCVFN